MKPGDVVLIRLGESAGGPAKLRPALILSLLPGPYQNLLITGISSQLHEFSPDWDELIQTTDIDFDASGLRCTSTVRLSYLYAADIAEIIGIIGQINLQRLDRLRMRLSKHLHG